VTPVLGKKRRVAAVIVRFSGPVDATQARSVAEYRLATAGKRGSFDAKNARVIPLKSATYDGATFTVTLIPTKAFVLSKTVGLRIDNPALSGLHDAFGRPIAVGPDGSPVAIASRGK
jgi:hypothetical protein